MKRNGFTLIELLAVIVILAVIALIATPIVLNVVENAKEKANLNSAYGLLDAGRLYYSESLLNEEKANKIKNLNNLWNEIKVSGNKPATGELYVNENGDVALSVILDNTCYQKTFAGDLSKLVQEQCELGFVGIDKTAPTISFQVLESPFNQNNWAKEDFYVQINIEDLESGGSFYKWCSTTNPTCNPDTKQANTSGSTLITVESATNKICVIATDHSGNESEIVCSDDYKLDKTKPTITGASALTAVIDGTVDLKFGVVIEDSLSGPNEEFTYDPISIDTSIEKTTTVVYSGYDLAGNEVSLNRQVAVKPLFVFDASAKTITGYHINGPKNVIIPNNINGVAVEKVADDAFLGQQLTSITIPNGISSIGSSAFANNQLTTITIPTSVTFIGNGAFNNNRFSDSQAFIYARNSNGTENKATVVSYGGGKRDSVIIPSNITRIEASAFANNQLSGITIPSSVTYIGDGAFNNNQLPDNQAFIYARNSNGTENKKNLYSYGGAKRDNVLIPDGVVNIGAYAFSDNQLSNITIPSSVKVIGSSAFQNNQLTNLTVPSSVTSIESYAFVNNQLSNITIPSSVTSIGVSAFNNNQLSDDQAFIYGRKSDGSENKQTIVSYGGSKRDHVTIPNGVTSIGKEAFANNRLSNVTIPSSVFMVGAQAFENNQLSTMIIPSSVTRIDSYAFQNNQLTSISIPSNVTTMGVGVFNKNQLPDDQAFIYERNADGSENKKTLISYGGMKKDNVIISSTVTTIGNHAFYSTNITSITIPSSVINIENYAFANNQLISITIPNGVVNIQAGAFEHNQLKSVILPDSLSLINNVAFHENLLTNITIPRNIRTIGNYAFDTNQLTSVKIIGKSSSSQFGTYGTSIWGWAINYNDTNITWNASS